MHHKKKAYVEVTKMNYDEFAHLEEVSNPANPFVKGFKDKDNNIIFVEPSFYTQLTNFKELYNEKDFNRIIEYMLTLMKEKHHIVFTYDYENPFINIDNYIYLEFIDLCDKLKIYIEDKSRGSDYGD